MLEELREYVPPVHLLDNGPQDPALMRTVAAFKRLAELWRLDAAFREAYRRDPEKAVADTGLGIEPEAFRLFLRPGEAEELLRQVKAGKRGPDAFPESYLLYQSAVLERKQYHRRMREELAVPDEPRLRIWRARQERRCRVQLGRAALNMMQIPLAFELSEGCSVGCPFCGIAAKGLKGIFRYTEENAALWRETLRRLHGLIGDAAGRGICYYASEPLDNPDYEKFIADFCREFGAVPLTTTAASTRDLERTRALLLTSKEHGRYFDRFSVLSPAMRDQLFAAFTPEELLRVILLPQFAEAPGNVFTKAGRSREENAVGGTIACASGFIVNMREKTVRLETPYASDQAHPTGEWILEKCAFASAAELEARMREMISRFMPESFDLKGPCRAACAFRLESRDGAVRAVARGGGVTLLRSPMEQAALDRLSALLEEGPYTGRELLDLLPDGTDLMSGFLLLNLLWYHGLLDQAAAS